MPGGIYHVNMLPATCHVYFGDVMMASINGRVMYVPFNTIGIYKRRNDQMRKDGFYEIRIYRDRKYGNCNYGRCD